MWLPSEARRRWRQLKVRLPRPRDWGKTVRAILSAIQHRPWFRGKDFTSYWILTRLPELRRTLTPVRQQPLRILEIGSWEGRSAVFFLRFLPNSRITCVDTFAGSPEHQAMPELRGVEQRFDGNLAEFGNRVEKLKAPAGAALAQLAAKGRQFDIAYIDGDHSPEGVTADSVGTWAVTRPGSIIIWDDYCFSRETGAAIDTFLRSRKTRIISKGEQMIIERLD